MALMLPPLPGKYISENSARYFLPDPAYLKEKSDLKTVKEWSEHQIKAIFEPLKTHVETSCLPLSMKFKFFNFYFFEIFA